MMFAVQPTLFYPYVRTHECAIRVFPLPISSPAILGGFNPLIASSLLALGRRGNRGIALFLFCYLNTFHSVASGLSEPH